MKQIVFLIEEPSMRELLKAILPTLIPSDVHWVLIVHEGKQDLERSIPRKLRAWQNQDARFVIVRDVDSADCVPLKQKLKDLCDETGRADYLIRLVCRELESWFLGDLKAVAVAFDLPRLAKLAARGKFRDPDRLGNASEELRRLVDGYQKIGGARAIAPHLDLSNNQSKSFQVFLDGVRRLVAAMSDIRS
ncbi:MAG: DUF4276 family protein [Blastocatellia bacterium]|nr:DUF4276 family protein [Blastocatellia bacterium]